MPVPPPGQSALHPSRSEIVRPAGIETAWVESEQALCRLPIVLPGIGQLSVLAVPFTISVYVRSYAGASSLSTKRSRATICLAGETMLTSDSVRDFVEVPTGAA